jgi:hypothetical protein
MLSSFNGLNYLPEDKGQYAVLYNSSHEEFVTFNLKCLSEGAKDNEDSLPYGNTLDKIHDWADFAKQKPFVVQDPSDHSAGLYNGITYSKKGEDDINDTKKGVHLDGSVFLDKLFVSDSPFEAGDYSIFFKDYHFDISNKYIGSPSPDEKCEGRNFVGGFGIQKFVHKSDNHDQMFCLGQPTTTDYDTKKHGANTLINNEETLKMRVHALDVGVVFNNWDKSVHAEDEVNKWDWSIWTNYGIDTDITYFEWFELPVTSVACPLPDGHDDFKDNMRGKFEAEASLRAECFEDTFQEWVSKYLNPNYPFDPDNEPKYLTPLGNFYHDDEARIAVHDEVFGSGESDCELGFCAPYEGLVPNPDPISGRPDSLEVFNECLIIHCLKSLSNINRAEDACGCGAESVEYAGPCSFEMLLNKDEEPGHLL